MHMCSSAETMIKTHSCERQRLTGILRWLQAVLVGDPKQLPATVLSRLADHHHLKQSLFERLQKV